MSEDSKYKAPRTVAEIQNEYSQIAGKAGDVQYRIYVFKKDLEMLNNQLRELNLEGAAAMERQAKEAAEKAAKEKADQDSKPSEEAKKENA